MNYYWVFPYIPTITWLLVYIVTLLWCIDSIYVCINYINTTLTTPVFLSSSSSTYPSTTCSTIEPLGLCMHVCEQLEHEGISFALTKLSWKVATPQTRQSSLDSETKVQLQHVNYTQQKIACMHIKPYSWKSNFEILKNPMIFWKLKFQKLIPLKSPACINFQNFWNDSWRKFPVIW